MLARCWLVGLVILCHGLVRQAKAQAPTAMIESTIQALRAQGYPKALEMAQAFVQAAPRDSWARTLRGAPISGLGQNKGNLLKQKECEKVVSHYEHAQSSIAKNPSALMQLGVCLVNTHELEETGPVSERLLTLQPDDWRKRYNLGLIQYLTHVAATA